MQDVLAVVEDAAGDRHAARSAARGGAISNSVTRAPRRLASTAAARPAQPAPTTAMADGRPRATAHRPRQLVRIAIQSLRIGVSEMRWCSTCEVVGLDLAQQRAVDVGHHQAGFLRAPVVFGEQGEGLVVGAVGALGLKAHQRGEAVAVARVEQLRGLDVELLQLVIGR